MPRYYCDYCDTYLTHDSPSVRKQHNAGYKHKANVRSYYQQFEEQQTQSLIDQKVKEHLVGQTAYQHQVGVAFNQHLVSLPSALPRPRLPVLPPSFMPIGASPQTPANVPLMPGVRAPVLPRPAPGPPGYAAVPTFPSVVMPPGASPVSMQPNGMPRPPAMPGAPSIASNGSLLSNNPGGYLGNPTATVSASSGTPPASLSQAPAATSLPSHVYAASPQPQGLQMMSPGRVGQSTASSSSQDGYSYGQASDASHSSPAY